MEKIKKFLRINLIDKMIWITLAIVMIVGIGTVSAAYVINKKTKSRLANSNAEKQQESMIEQENLVNTSKMSEEELKKLNEEELKKAEEKEKEENDKKGNKIIKPVKNKYYIKVNYGAQVVTIYTYDKNGNYTVPVRACVCSTGAATPTSGVYRISWKAVWGLLYGNVWGHYSCQIVGDILFHSVPYKQDQNDTLVSAYYDRLGTKDSMGCVRLTTIDAKWIYDNCPSGTQVEFYSSSNPGPLGKPIAKKVSNAPGNLKNWDPTDPDPANPWRTYKQEEEEKKQNQNSTSKPAETTNSTNSTTQTEQETTNPIEQEKPTEPTTQKEQATETPTDQTTSEDPSQETPTDQTTSGDSNLEIPADQTTPDDPDSEIPTEPTTPEESEKGTPIEPAFPEGTENPTTEPQTPTDNI